MLPDQPAQFDLKREADMWLARYQERPEDSIYRYRLDANGNPVFPFVARHVDLVGAAIWNGVKSEKNKRRPHGGWYWTTILRTFHPSTKS
jgi:hypothetical protein